MTNQEKKVSVGKVKRPDCTSSDFKAGVEWAKVAYDLLTPEASKVIEAAIRWSKFRNAAKCSTYCLKPTCLLAKAIDSLVEKRGKK